MSAPSATYEAELQALGRLLDQRAAPPRALCVLQSNGGFIVHALQPGATRADAGLEPATIVIAAADLKAAMDECAKPAATGWLKRR